MWFRPDKGVVVISETVAIDEVPENAADKLIFEMYSFKSIYCAPFEVK